MKNRFLGGVSFLPVFAAETGAGGGGDGKQAEMQLDPAEVAQHGDPDWEANDPGDIGTVAVEGDGDPEPDTGKKPEPEADPKGDDGEGDPEPDKPAAGAEDDGEPKTPEQIKAAYEASQKALKAITKRLSVTAAEKRRLNEQLQATIKEAPKADAGADGEGEPQRADFKSKAEFDKAVEAEATRRAAINEFNNKCNAVEESGSKTFGAKWPTIKQNLGLLDDNNRIPFDLLSTALETDDPAKVLFELGSDIELATEFMGMTPMKRAIRMAKLAEPKAAPPRKESRAPPPVEPIGGKGGGDDRPNDRDSDEEWNRKEDIRERALIEARRKRGY